MSSRTHTELQSMEIRQQIVDLLLIENLGVAGHFVAAETNYVGDAIVVGGHPAHRKILPPKHAFHAGTLPSPRRVGRMTAVAIVVVDPAPCNLLRIESEFSIALAALHVTADQKPEHPHRNTEAQRKPFRIFDTVPSTEKNARSLHSSFQQTATMIKQSHAHRREPSDGKTSNPETSI